MGGGKILPDDKIVVTQPEQGRFKAFSAICTHLGCLLGWNPAMRTWDCSCHGSSFARDGTVLHGPAVRDLKHIPLEAPSMEKPESE